MKIRNVTWQEVEQYVEKIKDKYKDRKFAGVFGISKGGILLAILVCNKLEIPLLLNPCPNALIIDDIAATGKTLSHYDNVYEITTMFYNKQSTVEPQYWLFKKMDKWIKFPWE